MSERVDEQLCPLCGEPSNCVGGEECPRRPPALELVEELVEEYVDTLGWGE